MKTTPFAISVSLLVLVACQSHPKPDIDWVHVPGGTFTMGMDEPLVSPGGDTVFGFVTPAHEVTVSDFHISRYEITVEQFRAFCLATQRPMPGPPVVSAYGDSILFRWQDDYPMLVTWEEADAFARWVGGRLPTEAEWEYAAKGGRLSQGFNYSGSDTASVVGWVGENADSTLHPVGQLKPNELGLYDMTGNLNEWVSDWWDPDYDYENAPAVDPKGPETGTFKISKGVGWYYNSTDGATGAPLEYGIHRPEVRYESPTDERTFGFGFRVVKD